MNSKNLLGSCHCEKLTVHLETTLDSQLFTPRACDCSFCIKHSAAYVSDPLGQLIIEYKDESALQSYRQGSESAKFLLCRNCGVLVAVVFEDNTTTYGAANSKCFYPGTTFGPEQVISPHRLRAEEKKSRWFQVWMPNVQLRAVGAS